MKIALENAKQVQKDIPICAVIVKNNEIISIKTNEKEKDNLVTSHAEILAINEANSKLKNWRLQECDMYVTLEPCPMCASAILFSRINNLYFGSFDIKYGAFSTNLPLKNLLNPSINVKGGFLETECNELLKNYFNGIRYEKETR